MIQTIDFYILDAIQNLRCGFLDYIMPKITFLGSGGLVWIIITLIYLIRRDTRRTGIMLASVLILGLIIGNGMLKNIIAESVSTAADWQSDGFFVPVGAYACIFFVCVYYVLYKG